MVIMALKNVLKSAEVNKVSYAVANKKVMRVTIPAKVAELLGLSYGDQVIWMVLEDENGKRMAAFKKIEPEEVF